MVDDLVRLYLHEDNQPGLDKLDEEQSGKYWTYMWFRGLVAPAIIDDKVVGYVEYWRIDFDLLGKMICHAPINIYDQDVTSGKICYLADIFILKEHRRSDAIQQLKQKFFEFNIDCDYFCGQALRKKTQPVKVFSRQEAFRKWAKKRNDKEVIQNGK